MRDISIKGRDDDGHVYIKDGGHIHRRGHNKGHSDKVLVRGDTRGHMTEGEENMGDVDTINVGHKEGDREEQGDKNNGPVVIEGARGIV